MLPLNKVVGCRLQPRAGSVPLNPILSESLFLRYFVDCVRDWLVCWQVPARWPKDWSFSFSISPSNEYSGLVSFGIDWFDLLAIRGTLRNLLQHHN